ncbi:hypothetical protein Tco_1049925, partial [Tanacetum coccineum]
EGFVRVMDRLEIQFDKEEVQECNSKKCLTELKKQFEKFLADTSDCKNKERTFQEILNKKHYVLNTQGLKDLIIRCLNGIEKRIDARVSHEEVLRIKEIDVNGKRKKERHMIKLEMLKLEKMTQKGECSNTGNAQRVKQSKKKCLIHFRLLHTLFEDFSKEDLTNACFSSGFHRAFSSLFGEDVVYFAPRLFFNVDKLEKQLNAEEFNEEMAMTHEGMMSKNALEIDNNVSGASHDKDNIIEAFKQDEDKYINNIIQLEAKIKDLENIVCKMGKSSQTFRQAIACHPKLYDAEVLGLHYVQPDVHDTEKILNDAEESQVKMKEKQCQFNYENINNLYDTFVPQTKLSLEHKYFSDPSTSNVSS